MGSPLTDLPTEERGDTDRELREVLSEQICGNFSSWCVINVCNEVCFWLDSLNAFDSLLLRISILTILLAAAGMGLVKKGTSVTLGGGMRS